MVASPPEETEIHVMAALLNWPPPLPSPPPPPPRATGGQTMSPEQLAKIDSEAAVLAELAALGV